ncbi:putative RPA12-13.7 kd subunit of DNA-directed RNA polymerase I [Ceraceosorus guamensis]|uniref:DNA-directed RNA polymerase subunit n=1 Tax=Ceraceosorus guamensis TaxID=1522189 RepID=A0A316W2B6_9BASI|nr:putative RPA12-13.7 kd subunit of DNA-directed RNA polymerase I [Ceraceosorus guamensis]PWN44006.1 putative RPA12-13.7 kd subunit of DNA-directed RNA polymerase I [Ceraceosorus guamensis]
MAPLPDQVGSLLFCPACGSLLDVPTDEDVVRCTPCGGVVDAKVYDNLSIVTKSAPNAFPSALRQKRTLVHSVDPAEAGKRAEDATIKEKCPNCGNEEMRFHTLQMRSADEGSTIFYTCPRCAYKFSQNN